MNQPVNLNLSNAFKAGWAGVTKNLLFFISLEVIFYALSLAPNLLDMLVPDAREDGMFLTIFFAVALASWVLQLLMSMGLIAITLRVLDGQSVALNQLFSQHKKLFIFIGASFLYGVIVFIGFLLLIIPGIYWAIKYQFYAYRIVDGDDGVFDSLRRSGELTEGVKWQLLGLSVVNMLLCLVGALFFGIGLLVAVPITMLATGYAYRQLVARVMPATATVPTAPVAVPPLT